MGNVRVILDRTPIDWSKPVRWNTGEPATAERVSGFILVTLGETYPRAIDAIMQRKHFKDSIVVHEDTGIPCVGLGEYAPDAWLENVEVNACPWRELEGSF